MVNWSARGASTVHPVKSASGTGNIPAWRGVSVTTYRRRELWERLPNKTDSAFIDSTQGSASGYVSAFIGFVLAYENIRSGEINGVGSLRSGRQLRPGREY